MVTVARGATLSIAPGVNVVFDGADSGLTVAGIEMSSGRWREIFIYRHAYVC